MGWTNLALLAAIVGIGWVGRRPPAALALPKPASTAPESDDELEALKAKLRQTQIACQLAQESEQFKAGFLARTAHELRSPLSSIMSLQQLILCDLCEDPAEERETVAQAYSAAQKLLALLDRLIGVSKAVSGSEPLKLQPVSLEDIFMEAESLLMLQAQKPSPAADPELSRLDSSGDRRPHLAAASARQPDRYANAADARGPDYGDAAGRSRSGLHPNYRRAPCRLLERSNRSTPAAERTTAGRRPEQPAL